MNTATKVLHHHGIAIPSLPVTLTKAHLLMVGLALAVLLSAFSLIYVKDMNRRLMSRVQTLQTQHAVLHTQWSQLLLKRGSLNNQHRIARLATRDLDMQTAHAKSIVVIS
jgi:cell division protein FtsL